MGEELVVHERELESDDADTRCTYRGVPFTGIGYEESPVIGREETTYKDGVALGFRSWYPSGVLEDEYQLRGNLMHGGRKDYDEAGRLVLEAEYDHGIELSARVYSETGELVESRELDPLSIEGRAVARLRAAQGR